MNHNKRLRQSWCPYCKTPAGPDCVDVALTKRQASKKIRRMFKKGGR